MKPPENEKAEQATPLPSNSQLQRRRIIEDWRGLKSYYQNPLTGEQMYEADYDIEDLLRPIMWPPRHSAGLPYLFLRKHGYKMQKDGRIRFDIVDLKDAMWDAWKAQQKGGYK